MILRRLRRHALDLKLACLALPLPELQLRLKNLTTLDRFYEQFRASPSIAETFGSARDRRS